MNNWKKIRDSKTAQDGIILNGDKKAVLLELKRCNGFDVVGEMSYETFYRQYEEIRNHLQKYGKIGSVYEVGCGSGANLYLFDEEFIAYRRKVIEDYDRRYAALPKLFYAKQFFRDFATKHGMYIIFLDSDMKEYLNNQFVFGGYFLSDLL